MADVSPTNVGQAKLQRIEIICPFYEMGTGSCLLVDSVLSDLGERKSLCQSDDYDRCPTYLGYLLRRTRPLRADSDWLDAG